MIERYNYENKNKFVDPILMLYLYQIFVVNDIQQEKFVLSTSFLLLLPFFFSLSICQLVCT